MSSGHPGEAEESRLSSVPSAKRQQFLENFKGKTTWGQRRLYSGDRHPATPIIMSF
jgi:hypothetical protein